MGIEELEKEVSCPKCAATIKIWDHLQDNIRLGPGDSIVCLICSEILVFTDDMGLDIANSKQIREADWAQIKTHLLAIACAQGKKDFLYRNSS